VLKLKVDPDYCNSSFIALRDVQKPNVGWKESWKPYFVRRDWTLSKPVFSAAQLDQAIETSLENSRVRHELGIMLSGGMDSAILATYLPRGTKAYTLRSQASGAQHEIEMAKFWAEINELDLRIVDVSWDDYLNLSPKLMKHKKSPIHSIEPLISKALIFAKSEGVTGMVFGENADSLFGGFDQLITSDRVPSKFIERYQFIDPFKVLTRPISLNESFKPHIQNGQINPQSVMEKMFADESLNSYINAARFSGVNLIAPFAELRMGTPMDYSRIAEGENKYLIRELFNRRYPDLKLPNKQPMPRAVGIWLSGWSGPKNTAFKELDMQEFSGDQKWMMYSLESFLSLVEGT
jgi:asparagine synthetase B (glutamine-hydrolysing)